MEIPNINISRKFLTSAMKSNKKLTMSNINNDKKFSIIKSNNKRLNPTTDDYENTSIKLITPTNLNESAININPSVNYQTKNDNTNYLTRSNNVNIIEKHEKIIHNLKENQLKLMQKLKKSKQKYNQLLEKFTKEIKVLKKKTTKVKLENGQTVEEYIYFRDRENRVDKLKRIDCLTLLNRFGESIVI